MKRLLISILLVAGLWSQVQATTVAIVVKDNTSGATIKADTLLGNVCRDILAWTVHYRDLDSVHTPGWWDSTGYALVIFAGTEVATAGAAFNNATVAADSVAKSNVPMMAIGNQFWNEINLGTGVLDNNISDPWYVVNLGPTHWITKTQHDSIVIWVRQGGATTNYALAYPDSINNRGITPLVIARTYMADTSRYLLGVCEAGASIVNTGDNRGTSNQRRSFYGLFQNQAKAMDSCQFYTLFLRTAAWTAGDTANQGLLNNNCISGTFELHDAWAGGSEPEGPYAVYSSGGIRMGHDYDDKISFLQIDSLTLQRKFRNVYRSIACSTVTLRTKVSSATVQYPTSGDSNWVQYWTFVPSRKRLHVTNFPYGTAPVASNTYPAACYYWARIDTVGGISTGDTILWASLAARDTTADVTLEYTDSSLYSRATFAVDTYFSYRLNPARWTSGLMSYDGSCIDYVARNLHDNQNALQPPGVEVGIYSGNSYASITGLPVISIHFSSSSTTDPMPTIAFLYDSLTMASTVGTNPSTDSYNHNNWVSNGSGGALSCVSVSDDAAWLTTTITGDIGQVPFGITAHIDVTGLAAGYYSALVTVQCDDADNSPATYKVALTLTAPTPAQTVEPRSGYRRDH